MLSQIEGLIILAVFGIAMIGLTWIKTHTERHADGFLVADRKVGIWQGSFSIAVTWVWAPAIFVCSLQAYNLGLPGVFWFIAPNIACFFLFAFLAIRLRNVMPKGYTIPEYVAEKYKNGKAGHIIFIIGNFLYLGSAIVANANAGGILLNAVSGIDTRTAIIGMGVIALSYSLLSGLKASIFTDVLQMIMVLGLALIIVPMVFFEAGGLSVYLEGLGGADGTHKNLFDLDVALTFGIPATITLMTAPIADQMFVQRAFAVKKENIKPTFMYGGLLFGLVPIALSALGFIGATLAAQGHITVDNPEMVAPVVINHLLPRAALYAFVLMAFAGLCSTLDSALCAMSSIGGIDIYKRYIAPEAGDKKLLMASRMTMLTVGVLSILIALTNPKILWVFMLNGVITATMFFPIVLSLYWKRMNGKGLAFAVGSALLIGLPFSIYANIKDDGMLVMIASLTTISISLIVSVLFGLAQKKSAP
ncbi:MAG: hypothetical protein GC131_03435 [Alphaproteobacteria bacterium]|nr:hypothetical protein [Alphaproteobacteria bacterium]